MSIMRPTKYEERLGKYGLARAQPVVTMGERVSTEIEVFVTGQRLYVKPEEAPILARLLVQAADECEQV